MTSPCTGANKVKIGFPGQFGRRTRLFTPSVTNG